MPFTTHEPEYPRSQRLGTATLNLVAIVGSLRAGSFSRAVFDAAVQLSPLAVELKEVAVRGLPFYDGDLEAVGDPQPVTALKTHVAAAHGLIVFTPEYNRSVPAVTKNAIDWLSRSPDNSVLPRATVGIVAATPGPHDAAGVRTHLGASIAANTDSFYQNTLGISSIGGKLTEGRLVDGSAREQLASWLGDFVEFVKTQQSEQHSRIDAPAARASAHG